MDREEAKEIARRKKAYARYGEDSVKAMLVYKWYEPDFIEIGIKDRLFELLKENTSSFKFENSVIGELNIKGSYDNYRRETKRSISKITRGRNIPKATSDLEMFG